MTSTFSCKDKTNGTWVQIWVQIKGTSSVTVGRFLRRKEASQLQIRLLHRAKLTHRPHRSLVGLCVDLQNITLWPVGVQPRSVIAWSLDYDLRYAVLRVMEIFNLCIIGHELLKWMRKWLGIRLLRKNTTKVVVRRWGKSREFALG